jgi:predicted transcriptional regulator
MKTLTKAEEEIMQQLWLLQKATVKEIIAMLPEPKPAYNTVSTIIRILETKNFVAHESIGKGYLYYPVVSKSVYTQSAMNQWVDNYFQGSFKSMVSFFMKKNDLSLQELEEILEEINAKK